MHIASVLYIHILNGFPSQNSSLGIVSGWMCVTLNLVQTGIVGEAQRRKKAAEEWDDRVKNSEEHLKKLESEKKREEYKSEFGVLLYGNADCNWDTYTRQGQYLSPWPHTVYAP